MKIADELRRSEVAIPRWAGGGIFAPGQIERQYDAVEAFVDGTNVAEYLFAGTSQEDWDWQRDFPVLAPPFKRFAITYRLPRLSRSGNKLFPFDAAGSKVAVFIEAPEAHPGGGGPASFAASLFATGVGGQGWLAAGVGLFDLSRDGAATGSVKFALDEVDAATGEDFNQQQRGEIADYLQGLMLPMGLALSFMHCKNASLVEQPIPEKVAKARARRGDRIPLLRYHTLEIEPMKKVLATQGHADEVGLQQALHICRGHFKDYRQSGLFGRFKGLFWWDSHVRGSAELGAVVKDYDIRTSKAKP